MRARQRHWTEAEKDHLYDHLERHKGEDGLYVKKRSEAFDHFINEWKDRHPDSDQPMNHAKVLSRVKSMGQQMGNTSYLSIFKFGPRECERKRKRGRRSVKVPKPTESPFENSEQTQIDSHLGESPAVLVAVSGNSPAAIADSGKVHLTSRNARSTAIRACANCRSNTSECGRWYESNLRDLICEKCHDFWIRHRKRKHRRYTGRQAVSMPEPDRSSNCHGEAPRELQEEIPSTCEVRCELHLAGCVRGAILTNSF